MISALRDLYANSKHGKSISKRREKIKQYKLKHNLTYDQLREEVRNKTCGLSRDCRVLGKLT